MKNFIPFSYEIKELTKEGQVQFYANAFNNLDSDYDISLPGSFKKTLRENGKRLRHFKHHDRRQMPGVVIDAKEDSIGLLITSQLIMENPLGRETYEEYKALEAAGKQMEHSVGVSAIKYEMDNETSIRKVSEWKLWEVSTLTAWGANSEALTVGVKNLKDASREELETELLYLKALLNISSYTELQLEQIEKQINYLNDIKVGLGAADKHSESTTLKEWIAIINL